MPNQRLHALVAATLFTLMGASNALATPADAAEAPPSQASSAAQVAPIVTLVVVPSTEKILIENRGGPMDVLALPGFLVTKKIQADRVTDFKQLLSKQQFDAPRELNEAILSALQAAGLTVTPTPGLRFLPDDPETVDYIKSAPNTSKVLVVTVRELGLYSGRTTRNFAPKLNISVELLKTDDETSLYDEWLYYGADASKETPTTAPSAPRHAYPSYGEAVEHSDELIASFRTGIAKLAQLTADQVKPLLLKP